MSFVVVLSDNASKFLNKLSGNEQARIVATLERCRINPFRYLVKILGSNNYRIRSGDYRLIVDIIQDKLVIFVIEVGKRKNIYK